MTRSHRMVHRLAWPVLAFVIGLGFVMALYLRPPPEVSAPPVAEESRR